MIQFPDIDPFLLGPFYLGDFPLGIRWYALAYIVGLLGCIWLATRLVRRYAKTVGPQDLDALFVWFVVGVIFGGRLFYVLFYGLTATPLAYSNPMQWIAVWDGGMSFHGGMFGVALTVIIYGALKRGIHTFELADYVAAVAPFGLFLGRLANFVNGELWGRATSAPWAVLFPKAVIIDAGQPIPLVESAVYPLFQQILDSGAAVIGRHPSQLYQAFFEGLLLFIALQILIRLPAVRARQGVVAGCFMAGYGLFRWTVEWFREPDAQLGFVPFLYPGATMGQLLSIPLALIGLALVAWAWRRGPVIGNGNDKHRG